MAGERPPARFSLRSQLWFRGTGKCLETATSHMQNVIYNLKKDSNYQVKDINKTEKKTQPLDFQQNKKNMKSLNIVSVINSVV